MEPGWEPKALAAAFTRVALGTGEVGLRSDSVLPPARRGGNIRKLAARLSLRRGACAQLMETNVQGGTRWPPKDAVSVGSLRTKH